MYLIPHVLILYTHNLKTCGTQTQFYYWVIKSVINLPFKLNNIIIKAEERYGHTITVNIL